MWWSHATATPGHSVAGLHVPRSLPLPCATAVVVFSFFGPLFLTWGCTPNPAITSITPFLWSVYCTTRIKGRFPPPFRAFFVLCRRQPSALRMLPLDCVRMKGRYPKGKENHSSWQGLGCNPKEKERPENGNPQSRRGARQGQGTRNA